MNSIMVLHMRLGVFANCLLQNNNVKQLNFVCLNVNYEERFSLVCFAFLFGILIKVLNGCEFCDQILLLIPPKNFKIKILFTLKYFLLNFFIGVVCACGVSSAVVIALFFQ